LAEWSKALASGASPKGRGFEPHRCQLWSLKNWSPSAFQHSTPPQHSGRRRMAPYGGERQNLVPPLFLLSAASDQKTGGFLHAPSASARKASNLRANQFPEQQSPPTAIASQPWPCIKFQEATRSLPLCVAEFARKRSRSLSAGTRSAPTPDCVRQALVLIWIYGSHRQPSLPPAWHRTR
jgi:hypothetical protein